MSATNKNDILLESMAATKKNLNYNISWYFAPVFLLFWLVLFFAVIIPIFNYLPTGITISEESTNAADFIGERAQRLLYDYSSIGSKVVGSYANENKTVQFLLDSIAEIKAIMHEDLYTFEIDVQQVSGAYIHWSMVNMYQGVQNVVVKLSCKTSQNENYLLLNTHFDSKRTSPGAGDAGSMVVVLLEILRKMCTSKDTFEHPIIFLFNGAEENPLQASHGFITQHKWAKNCKALINLDAAGSDGREILFQSGPNHPWLMRYYADNIKHPFATTLGEEIFQSGIIPSDTDFRIFRDYGHVPGLDIARFYNGYVYHTKYDDFVNVPIGSLQNTGDNVLALVRAFVNASELNNIEANHGDHAIFFDYMGIFFVYYNEQTGIILNYSIAILSLILVGVSLWQITAAAQLDINRIAFYFVIIFALHTIGVLLAFGLPLFLAFIFDKGKHSMTWFTNTWLLIGIYVCPSLFGLCAPTLIYFNFSTNHKIGQPQRVLMALHAHCILLAVFCIILTAVNIRSSYLLTISLLFYAGTTLINIITGLSVRRFYYWSIIHILGQVLPFLYFWYLMYTFLIALIPMMGRNDSAINPDLLISSICALGTVLTMGFLILLMNLFHRPHFTLGSLVVISFIFSMIAITSIGFPYRPKTNVQRVDFLQVQRVFYEYNQTISFNDSGYLFYFQDRHMEKPLEADTALNFSGLVSIADDCDKIMMCGMPLFAHRWFKARKQDRWLPRAQPIELPGKPQLEYLNKTVQATTARYTFRLTGPSHMSLFIQPEVNVQLQDWSFLRAMLDDPQTYPPPYHIYFSYGNDSSPLTFHLDFKKTDGNFDMPIFQLGISGHYIQFEYKRDAVSEDFISHFPNYSFLQEWPSSYERYIF